MKRLLLMIVAIGAAACEAEPQADGLPKPELSTSAALPADKRQTQPAKLIPKPKDQVELDRLILAGYTPHADHLHAPGVKSCPQSQGNEAVM